MLFNMMYQGGIRALLDYDPTIFDGFNPPEDPDGNEMDVQMIVDHIVYKYGDAPLAVPDPTVIKYYIGNWSARRKPLWDRYYRAILAEYNPLENYDRTEKTTDYLTHGHTVTTDDDLTHGETVTTDDDLTNGLTTENTISADNASTYQPDSKSANTGIDQRDISEVHTGTDQRDISEKHTGIDKRDYDSHVFGNIGVTTSQQMLESEIDLIPRLDLCDFIANDFHEEFNLMVYNY